MPLTRQWLRSRCAACIILMQLCGGCSGRAEPAPEPAPVMIWPARCARPAKPDLPRLSGLEFLESREGYARLKLRDTRLRAYLAGLEDALDCYEAQAVVTKERQPLGDEGTLRTATASLAADCDSSDAQPAPEARP